MSILEYSCTLRVALFCHDCTGSPCPLFNDSVACYCTEEPEVLFQIECSANDPSFHSSATFAAYFLMVMAVVLRPSTILVYNIIHSSSIKHITYWYFRCAKGNICAKWLPLQEPHWLLQTRRNRSGCHSVSNNSLLPPKDLLHAFAVCVQLLTMTTHW